MADPKNIIKGTPIPKPLKVSLDSDRIISYGGKDTLYGLEETTNSMATQRAKATYIGTLRNLSKFLAARVMILLLGVV